MAGSHSGQPEAAVTRVTFSHIWFLSFLSGAWMGVFWRGLPEQPLFWEDLGGEGSGGVGWGEAGGGEEALPVGGRPSCLPGQVWQPTW